MKELIEKSLTTNDKRTATRHLVEQHSLSLSRSCLCVGLHRSAYYRVPAHWTVRDASIIAALAKRVEARPNRGYWKCRKLLKRQGRP